MKCVWDNIEKPTTKQRRALHRLGYSDWLISQLTRETASKAIERGLELMKDIREEKPIE